MLADKDGGQKGDKLSSDLKIREQEVLFWGFTKLLLWRQTRWTQDTDMFVYTKHPHFCQEHITMIPCFILTIFPDRRPLY